MKITKHDSTIIDDGAQIGENCKIWHWTHICSGAKIGSNCTIGQNVFIGNKVAIGNGCKIQNNVSIYDEVTIEDDVFCGPSMVFTNVINPRAFINRKNEFKTTLVKKGASIGANATIICGTIIGEYSFIAAGSVVTKTTKNFGIYVGVPARQIGWMCKAGLKIPTADLKKSGWLCPVTKEKYILIGKDLGCTVIS
jgi:UDP-2-acetamido-3-amino-2,3-dideoxy-glucuronate N-acetyltransferase